MKNLQEFRKVELQEAELDTADIKIGSSGRKVRAHRFKIGDAPVKEEIGIEETTLELPDDPPFVLILKRKAIRLYPNRTKIALYYNQKLDKYFSITYGSGVDAPVQAEEVEYVNETVMDQLHKIVSNKQANSVKFANGQSKKVDHFTASAITQVHNALNDDNKKKFADMVHKSPEHLAKAADFAFRRAK